MQRPSADLAGPPHRTPAQERVRRAARSGASSSSQASGGSVGAGPPPRPTPPSRRRLRSGSGVVERHGLSHHQRGLLPLPSLHPRSSVLTPPEGPESCVSSREGDGEAPLRSEITPDVPYSRCIHGLLKPAPCGHACPSAALPPSPANL